MYFIKEKIKSIFEYVLAILSGGVIVLVIAYVLTVPCFINFNHSVFEVFGVNNAEKCSFVDFIKSTYSSGKDIVSNLFNKNENPVATYTIIEEILEIDYDEMFSKNHYYSLLNDTSKEIYIKLYEEAQKLNADIRIDGKFTKQEITNAVQYFNYDYPEYFFLDINNCELMMYYHLIDEEKDNYYYYFTLKYKGDASNLEYEYYKNKYISEEVLKNIEGKSEKEGIKYIHDYIIDNVDYDLESKNNQDIRSSMQNGKTVCAGYAKMFKYLCDEAGYDCAYVIGEADANGKRGYHAWNVVWIDNESYGVDVTWDDSTKSNKYFLISNEQMSKNHFANESSVVLCNK